MLKKPAARAEPPLGRQAAGSECELDFGGVRQNTVTLEGRVELHRVESYKYLSERFEFICVGHLHTSSVPFLMRKVGGSPGVPMMQQRIVSCFTTSSRSFFLPLWKTSNDPP